MGLSELIDYEVALDPKRNRYSTWKRTRERITEQVWPEMSPSFRIHPGAKIFTIGSCFARNIEEHLRRLGFTIPTLDFGVPLEEWPARQNGILNKYTPAAIFQEMDWARKVFLAGGKIAEADSAAFLYECTDGSVIDTNLGGFVPVSRDRFFERRSQVYDTFKEAFNAEYIVMTLGFVETWFDREQAIYIQESPVGKNFARNRARFGFQLLTYDKCREFIQRTIDMIREMNVEAKFLITTSPVPLSRTFTDKDIIVANAYSKSLLRTVAGDLSASNRYVDYFPSYESVMLTKSADVWGPDLRHVNDGFVGKIVARLTDTYCIGLEDAKRTLLQSYIGSKQGSLPDALESARQAVAAAAQSAEPRKHYGYLLAQTGNLPEAERQYEQGIALMPGDAELHYRLSELLATQGRLTDAINAAHRSTKLAPDNEPFRRHLARLLMKQWKFGKAAAQFVLASGHRRLIKTTRPRVKRFFRFVLPRLE